MESTRFYTSRASLLRVKAIKRQRKWTQGDLEKGKGCVLGEGQGMFLCPSFQVEFEGEALEEPLTEFGTCSLPVGSRERACLRGRHWGGVRTA